jgi:hypothetical protein
MKGRFGAPLGGRCDLEGVRVASTGTWVAVLNLGDSESLGAEALLDQQASGCSGQLAAQASWRLRLLRGPLASHKFRPLALVYVLTPTRSRIMMSWNLQR